MTAGRLALAPLDLPADLDRAADLVARAQVQSIGWVDSDHAFVASLLTNPAAVPDEHRFALAGDALAGLLAVECEADSREVFVDAFAVGEDREARLGLLVDAGLEAAARLAGTDAAPAADGVDPYLVSPDLWQVAAGHHPEDGAYGAVLDAHGFRPVRRFWRMGLDLAGRAPQPPVAPAGVTMRPARSADDVRTVFAVEQASFADHFGIPVRPDFETWLADISARPGHDPERWWIAELDGEPVGVCLLDNSKAEHGEDHVRRLGVLPSARGRGIGRWLLECAAAEAAARGQSALTLSVDGANTTGATRLYESVGFAIRHVVDMWVRPLVLRPDAG